MYFSRRSTWETVTVFVTCALIFMFRHFTSHLGLIKRTGFNVASFSLFQEFECGLSVQSTHLEKQEWSFTLYDFDGRGRVTKEVLCNVICSCSVINMSSLYIQKGPIHPQISQ